MHFLILLLLSVCFAPTVSTMERPASPKGSSDRLKENSRHFAQAASQLRKQVQEEESAGFLAGVAGLWDRLVGGTKIAKTEAPLVENTEAPSVESNIDTAIAKMNDAFQNWKRDPSNLSLREELSAIQANLMRLQSTLLNTEPKLSLRINAAISKVSQERNEILRSNGHSFKPQLPSGAPVAAQPVRPEVRFTQIDVQRAISQLQEQRTKNRRPYVWGARIGLLGALGSLGYAYYSQSFQPIKAAAGFTGLLVFSGVMGSRFAEPTQADAKRFLEQKNR